MIMKKIMTIFTALTVLAICSCAKKAPMENLSMPMSMPMLENSINNIEIESVERKIIKWGYINFETADVNKTKSFVIQVVNELNGDISSENVYYYYHQIRHRLAIRVPADKFDLLLTTIYESAKKIDDKSIFVSDVTEEYIDIEVRIKTKKALQARYIELLKQATKVDEILNIEKEIGKLQEEIESVEGRMRYLNDNIVFSTLTVGYYQKTTSKFEFSSKFVDGIKNGWNVFLSFIIGVSQLWVFILLAALAVYLFKLWKKREKK